MKETEKMIQNMAGVCKLFAVAILAAILILAFTGCRKSQPDAAPTQEATTQQTTQPETTQPETTQPETTQAPTEESTQAVEETEVTETTGETKEAWKVEFEKSLLENYGVTPDHYEDLGNGVYQVYVEIDGKVVPYVAVDSATGDYHG